MTEKLIRSNDNRTNNKNHRKLVATKRQVLYSSTALEDKMFRLDTKEKAKDNDHHHTDNDVL